MASEIKVDTIVNAGGDNDSGIDLATNDNIKFNIAGSQKAIIDSSGNVKIGTTSDPSHGTADNHVLAISGKQNNGSGVLAFIDTGGNSDALLTGDNGTLTINVDSSNATADSSLQIRVDNTERFRIKDDGTIQFKGDLETVNSSMVIRFRDASENFKAGIQAVDSSGQMVGSSVAGDFALRSQSDMLFSTGGNTERMRLDESGNVLINCSSARTQNTGVSSGVLLQVKGDIVPDIDAGNTGHSDLGDPSFRYEDVFSRDAVTTGSDQNDKQNIADPTTKELKVAQKLSSLFKTYKWKDRVTKKGDKARTHTGIVAQDIQKAFSAEGLDATKYGMFMSNTWTNEEGKEQTRLAVRYPELFSFIFSSIEARLTALESK